MRLLNRRVATLVALLLALGSVVAAYHYYGKSRLELYLEERESEAKLKAITVVDPKGLARLDDKFGFRNVKLGAEVGSFGSLVGVDPSELQTRWTGVGDDEGYGVVSMLIFPSVDPEDEHLVRWYKDESEDLRLGPVDLQAVYYKAFKDRILGVFVRSVGDSCRSLRFALETAYGAPENPGQAVDRRWFGKRVTAFLFHYEGGACWMSLERADDEDVIDDERMARVSRERRIAEERDRKARDAASKL